MNVVKLQQSPAPGAPGTWPCGSCGKPFLVARSWRVILRDNRNLTSEIICPDCADDLAAAG